MLKQDWLNGKKIKWYRDEIVKKIELPTYQFNRKIYWKTANELSLPKYKSVVKESLTLKKEISKIEKIRETVKNIFEDHLFEENIKTNESFESLGGDSFSALLIMHDINKELGMKIPVSIFQNNLSVEELTLILSSYLEN